MREVGSQDGGWFSRWRLFFKMAAVFQDGGCFQDGGYFSKWRLFFKMAAVFQDGGWFSRFLKRGRNQQPDIYNIPKSHANSYSEPVNN